jgi:hypothetical protein
MMMASLIENIPLSGGAMDPMVNRPVEFEVPVPVGYSAWHKSDNEFSDGHMYITFKKQNLEE